MKKFAVVAPIAPPAGGTGLRRKDEGVNRPWRSNGKNFGRGSYRPREFFAGVDPKQLKRVEADIAKSRTRDSMHAYEKLTQFVDGEPRIIHDPALIVPTVELLPPGKSREQLEKELRDLFRDYRHSLASDTLALLEQFHYVGQARKVVGVGSVGTRDRVRTFPRRR